MYGTIPGQQLGYHQAYGSTLRSSGRRGPAASTAGEAGTKPTYLNIRNIHPLMYLIGYPDITDAYKGGIAIWSSNTLQQRGYKFLHRVEIIDESVPSLQPVRHFSNVYIWVKLRLTSGMIDNIVKISTDFYYDKGKELLVVRSDSLDTAVAQAALIGLYSQGKVSYYEIIGNNLLETYYRNAHKPKSKKVLYTALNNASKR